MYVSVGMSYVWNIFYALFTALCYNDKERWWTLLKRNEDCIRSIMLYLEENLSAKKTLKGKELYAPLENFSKEDIDESIIIILERKLVSKKGLL